ncbi:MAG: ribokinase [Arcicella sp.]|nr:ribokinase [Arcicella sp.]
MAQTRIFVVGSSNTDMVIKSDKLPAPGETILGNQFLMNAGGKGANQAVAAAKLGADVHFVGKVGDDIFGRQAVEGLKNVGINTRFVYTDPNEPSGVALILVDKKGENSISVASGANSFLNTTEVTEAIAEANEYDLLLVQLETSIQTVETAIQQASLKNMPVILNPAPAQEIPLSLYPKITFITPNETETEFFTGVKVIDLTTARKAAQIFHERGTPHVIITLGAKGAFYHSETEQFTVDSPTVNAVDTTAAGDVFNGALTVALSEKKSIREAITFACMAAAISVTRMGAQASAPTRAEVS